MTDSAPTPSSSLEHLREVIAHLGTCMSDMDLKSNAQPINPIARVNEPEAADTKANPQDSSEVPAELPAQPPAVQLSVDNSTMAEAVFLRAQDAVIVLSDFQCVASNPAALATFVCSEEQMRDGNFLSLIAQKFDVGKNFVAELEDQLIRESSVVHELSRSSVQSAQPQSGSTEWYEFRFRKIDLNGANHIMLNVVDVSDRKNRENELAKQCNFLIKTINAVPEPVSVKSSNLEIVLVNDSFCETHNVNRDEVIGTAAPDVLNGANLNESAYYEREVLATGIKQATIDAFFDDDHEPFILSTYHACFNDRESGHPFVVAASRDVTTEMKRENRLRLLASVFEAAQEGVAILSPQGAICEANPEFIATIGKSHAKVLGTCLSTVVNCEPHHFSEIIELAQAGRPWFGNIKMINKRHEEIPCWLSLSPSKNLRGETTNLIAMISDITQIEETKRELRRQALHDNLTDLPNRRYYRKQIADLIESDVDGKVRFGVSFPDLDDFKIVNDTLGHDAGDQLLVEVSRRVRQTLGPDCFMARFGGDEFALLTPEQKGEPLRANSSSRAVVEALSRPFDLAGHEVHIGVSVGTTIYPDHASDVESLMRHADVAMYKAKEEGKNKVTMFSSELVDIVEKRQAMLSELRTALEHKDLNVVYQPKLCLKKNRVTSCEALVRWTKTDGTVVSPAEFIPLAEDFGLISTLGDQVMETVCLQAKQWHDAGVLPGPIAVNLSPRQLKEPNFLDRLVKIIAMTEVDPKWIELEITENAVMEDKDRALKVMHQLNEIGISIAMDDFGTGYSSLGNIRDFPIRTLKLDTTFVKDLPTCSRAVAIAKTVMSLGHGLDLKVVAEGVETQEQHEFLQSQGCDMAQGYLISRPVPAEEYIQFTKGEK
jgi:diguanylate cyclase (GGDEF)-like protein/PAS domain S-box-containing protein